MFQNAKWISSSSVFTLSSLLLGGCGGSASPPGSAGASPCSVAPVTISHSTGQPNAPQVVVLDKIKYPKALCNDGTPAAYVLRKGFGLASNRWVIALQGGGFCSSEGTCSARAKTHPALVGSTRATSDPKRFTALHGLQSADASVNPDFYDANQVNVLYCSSDAWSGNKAASGTYAANDVTTWNFQGHAIVQAVVADLKDRMGLAGASEVLFTGLSAGAIGVMVNVNDVAASMPAAARFAASTDGAYSNDVYNFSATAAPPNYISSDPAGTRTTEARGRILWNGTGESKCVAKAVTPEELNACYYTSSLLGDGGTVPFPMFVVESEEDTAQLQADKVPLANLQSTQLTSEEQAYVQYFAAHMRAGLALTNSNVSIFSPKALIHTEQSSDTLFNQAYPFVTATLTNRQANLDWYQAPCSVKRNIAQ